MVVRGQFMVSSIGNGKLVDSYVVVNFIDLLLK